MEVLSRALRAGKPEIKQWGVILEIAPDSSVDIDDVAVSQAGAGAADITMPTGVPKPVEDYEKVAVAFPAQGAITVDGRLDEPTGRRRNGTMGSSDIRTSSRNSRSGAVRVPL